jgi:arylsulfatase A-like enzyme
MLAGNPEASQEKQYSTQTLRTLQCAIPVACALLLFVLTASSAQPPNIIVILADDLGYADVGFNGSQDIPTPNIDTLASQGIIFSNGYVSHPFCSPTRAGLMTGRYQHRFGHENNPTYLPDDIAVGLPLNQVTLANVLKDAGYTTIAVGKWHLGAAAPFHPNRRGFTDFFGFLGGGHVYMNWTANTTEYGSPILRDQDPVTETDYLTDAFSREAVAYITAHHAAPFFLYLAYNAPHGPLQAPSLIWIVSRTSATPSAEPTRPWSARLTLASAWYCRLCKPTE